jgi:hypothetical protein
MEQEVRELLETYVFERHSVLDQIEAVWDRQTRRPAAREIDRWIAAGRFSARPSLGSSRL